ncbi:ovostatin-like [Bufo gargarizans]|uniref:ovostatin-like n=1 Tax=Bufo gargarizans TaxID=30331 RepID=UPI001CF1F088|nr:ovostatin-like [Bufo gargarizans]
MRSLLLSVLLPVLISAGTSEPQYALYIPAKLNSGEIEKACMNLQGYEQTLQLNVVLQYSGINFTIFSEKVSPPTYFQCNNFQIPVVRGDVPAFVLLSVSGEDVQVLQRYSVVITEVNNIYLVQMDKPIYKPGQKVLFNLVSLNQQLLPVNATDPSGSRLVQWLDQKSQSGLVSLEFSLVDDAVSGSYVITAEIAPNAAVSQWFSVDEYVLPRFDVNLEAPTTLSILDETLHFNICAEYTYGEPVPGAVAVKFCRQPTYGLLNNCFKDKNGACFYKTAQIGRPTGIMHRPIEHCTVTSLSVPPNVQLASDGTYQGEIDLTSIQMDLSGAQTNLNLSVTVTENGTGIQVTKTQYLWVTSQLASISFNYEHMNQFYKRGLPYSVMVLLTDEKGLPIAGEEVQLNIDGVWGTQTVITGLDGSARYEIDTSNFLEPNFTIKASYLNTEQCYYSRWQGPDYPTTEYTVFRFYSETGSFLQIIPLQGTLQCGQKQKIEVQFLLSADGVGVGATKATFYYLTMSRSRIVQSGQQDVELSPAMNGTLSFDLPITSEIAFRTDLIVYSLLQTELIADTRSLNIESCFKNEVSLSFSKEIGPPASDVDLQISASPGSLCAVKVIDSSILLLQPDTGMTPEAVYSSLQNWFSGYFIGQFNVEEPGPPCQDPNKQIFYNGNYYVPVSSDSDGDTYNYLKNIGLIVGTDVTVRKPEVCSLKNYIYPQGIFPKAEEMAQHAPAPYMASTLGGSKTIETVRGNFSDTWVWTMVTADSQGHGNISQTVPDTITEWEGSMICTSETDGFGMTKSPSEFTTFLPFFIEVSLPYSFIRGELLVLSGFVSNYLEQCVKILVSLSKSDDYQAALQEGEQNACICSEERASYIWNINATSLGVINFTVSAETTYIGQTCDGTNDPSQPSRKDTVIQTIIVEAEGIKKEVTSSNLICIQGDIIGLPLQNLQNLLQMPFGCGEQNLVRLAPIPHLLDYLNATGQLTEEIVQKGIQFMNTGYYRELRYKLSSGAYSLFGGFGSEENSWLTAYVFKTFEKCKQYIYIDERIQQQTLIWLGNNQQLDSGCFRAIGDSFMKMKKGADEDLIYTAFLAITLLESNYSLGMTLLDSTLTCLQNALKTEQSLSNQVLMVYTFTLAKDWDRRYSLLKSLKSKAISEGGMIHWEREDKPEVRPIGLFYPLYSAAEVEITAYILLSIAIGPNITQDELTYMAQISVWLIRQQNSYGGFHSTLDTVVALKALSAFAKLIFNPNAEHIIRLNGQNQQSSEIKLNKDNRLLVQRQSLIVPGDYSISITGIGCCLIQTTLQYNVPVPQENSAFHLSVNTSSMSCVNGVAYTFTIGISVSYRGNRPQSNMAIIDIALLSGYQADYWSLQELVEKKVISNSETKNNHVNLYLKSVTCDTTYLSFNVMMGNRVLNVKTGSIYVYDYYETADNGYASYRHPCAQQ